MLETIVGTRIVVVTVIAVTTLTIVIMVMIKRVKLEIIIKIVKNTNSNHSTDFRSWLEACPEGPRPPNQARPLTPCFVSNTPFINQALGFKI